MPERVFFGQAHGVGATALARQHRLTDQALFWVKMIWSCHGYVPVSQLIYAAFRSNAKGLLPPGDEWRRRGL